MSDTETPRCAYDNIGNPYEVSVKHNDKIITCGSCDMKKCVGDNKQYLICSKTDRELPDGDLMTYIDGECPFYKKETDIQKANDHKFTLKVIAMLVIVLFTSCFVIGLCMMFAN